MSTDEKGRPRREGGPGDDERLGGGNVVPIVRRGRRNWGAVWEPMRAQARAAAEARRARVLAHPDLAEALTGRTVGYARPEQWTGYVPPEFDPPPHGGGHVRNTSARRTALVDICAEALRREQRGES